MNLQKNNIMLFNYVLPSLDTKLSEGHIEASLLKEKITNFKGKEAYYSLFDMEKRDTFQKYQGPHYPALGYFVLDFDSSSDLEKARRDCLAVIRGLHLEENTFKIFFSGSKGFHLYIREEFFPLTPSSDTAKQFERIIIQISKQLKLETLDDSIYQANRKFRLPNSLHPKTSLFKVELDLHTLETGELDYIKSLAKTPRELSIFNYNVPSVKWSTLQETNGPGDFTSSFGLGSVKEADIAHTGFLSTFKNKICVSRMETQNFKEGERHQVAIALIAEYHQRGETQDYTENKIEEFCQKQGILERFSKDYLRAISDTYSGSGGYTFGCYSGIKYKLCSGTCSIYSMLNKEKRAVVTDLPTKKEKQKEPAKNPTIEGVPANFPDRGNKGKILGTKGNLKYLLDRMNVNLNYDIIKKDIEIHIPNTTWLIDTKKNNQLTSILSEAARCLIPLNNIPEYVALLAGETPYNPVANWVESEPWDGVSRLQALYDTIKSAQDGEPGGKEFKETLIRKWLISAIAAAYKPEGASVHGVLVFSGAQNMGKTAWFKRLVPQELKLTADGLTLDPKDKDSVYNAVSNWLVELGELDATFKKSDIAQLKAFLTKDKDRIRLPYHREYSQFARRTAFFASVNDSTYLNDPTGNRRFWTIECDSIDYEHEVDMQQLWAEVLALYKAGARWFLTKEEIEKLNTHNDNYEAEEPIEEKVRDNLKPSKTKEPEGFLTCTQIAGLLGIHNPTQRDTRAISRAIRKVFKLRVERNSGKKGFYVVYENSTENNAEDTKKKNSF